jgi:hypothetical protein
LLDILARSPRLPIRIARTAFTARSDHYAARGGNLLALTN